MRCELTKSEYEQDCKPLTPFDAFGPTLARADALSRKIARAARLAREGDDEDADQEPWETAP